jgi:CspA family cold shock protein
MPSGVVKKFDMRLGYGFIRSEGILEDIFVHHSAIRMDGFRTLEAGDKVEFRIQRGQRGFLAVDVVRTESAGVGG